MGRHFEVIVVRSFFRSFGTLVRVRASYVGCFATCIASAEVRPLVLGRHNFHHPDELFDMVCAVQCHVFRDSAAPVKYILAASGLILRCNHIGVR